jgi:hypothetical protein
MLADRLPKDSLTFIERLGSRARLFVSRALAGRGLLPSVYPSPPDLLAQEFYVV